MREYTLPGGEKIRDRQAFYIDGVGSFPRNWLQLASAEDLTRHGITVEELPDPAPPPPTADNVRQECQRRMILLVSARDPQNLAQILSNAQREQGRLTAVRIGIPTPEHAANPDPANATHWQTPPRAWTTTEATRAAELLQYDAVIEALRAASNAMEASPPADFADDRHWPSV